MNADAHSTVVTPRRLWFGLLAAPAAWALHEIASAIFAGLACADGDLALDGLSSGGVRLVLGAFSLIVISMALTAGMVAFRNLRRLSDDHRLTRTDGHKTVEFVAMAGLLVSSISLLGLLYAGLPILFIENCGRWP